jgi:hypothetical protein
MTARSLRLGLFRHVKEGGPSSVRERNVSHRPWTASTSRQQLPRSSRGQVDRVVRLSAGCDAEGYSRVMHAGRSRFGRLLSRKVVGGEAELTELLALLLESDGDFARELVKRWTGRYPGGEVRIATEVTKRCGRIDLELDARGNDPAGALVWVETKRDMLGPSSADQLSRYQTELKELLGDAKALGKVVYLTRHGVSTPKGFEPEGFPETWQTLGEWATARPTQTALARDFVDYLKEEMLMVEPLVEDDFEVLERQHRAHGAARLVFEGAFAIIDRAMQDDGLFMSSTVPKIDKWPERWPASRDTTNYVAYEPPQTMRADWPHGLFVEWNLNRRITGPQDGKVALAAGLTWWRGEGPEWAGLDATRQVLEDAGGFCDYRDDCPRLFRFIQPADLVRDKHTPEEQAREVAKWVTDALSVATAALRSNPGVSW